MMRWMFVVPTLIAVAVALEAHEVLELENQFGDPVPLLPGDRTRILVYADRKGAPQTGGWRAIIDSGPCPRVEAANLDAVPFFVRAPVRKAFKDSDPIALDWRGEIAERLGFERGLANVYLLDVDGRLLAHFRGLPNETEALQLRSLMQDHCDVVD